MRWREALARERPLLLPGAYDALSARLIERAGFTAYMIGGFSLIGARHALPDVDLASFGEIAAGVRDAMAGSSLPVLVDVDTGYGDVKNVVRTIRTYEAMGVAAVFMEDQVAPKRCGHLAGKRVVPVEEMERKIRAAAAARDELFIIARTDARATHGIDEALRRAERYLKAGADGLFIEAPESVEELAKIGRAFDAPQACNMLRGGRTPILSNAELGELGFAMVMHGITPLFRIVPALQETLRLLKGDHLHDAPGAVSFDEFKEIVGLLGWAAIEEEFGRES